MVDGTAGFLPPMLGHRRAPAPRGNRAWEWPVWLPEGRLTRLGELQLAVHVIEHLHGELEATGSGREG